MNCKNCEHEVRLRNNEWLHVDVYSLSNECMNTIKANKKIRHEPRSTEPIKYLACGCTNPQPKEDD